MCSPRAVDAIENATKIVGHSPCDISGCDACNLNIIAPPSMIFVLSTRRLSYNELRDASETDCIAGVNARHRKS